MAKISILMPVYNAEKYLEDCFDSILAQTYKNYEVLIIDDGSTDSSGQICNQYVQKSKQFMVKHQDNQGSGITRNRVIEWALNTNSEYIVWIDADDIVHPQFLEYLIKAIEQNPENDMIQCGYSSDIRELFWKNETINIDIDKRFNKKELLTEMLGGTYGVDFTLLWNKIYKKQLYNKARVCITENVSGKMQDDINILSQIYQNSTGCATIKQKLYYYRIVSNSIQHKKISNVNLEYFYIYRDLYKACKQSEFSDFADYLSERIIFEIASKLRFPKKQYMNYAEFYVSLKHIFTVLREDISFTFTRKDLKILYIVAQKNFFCFRIYALFYNVRAYLKKILINIIEHG